MKGFLFFACTVAMIAFDAIALMAQPRSAAVIGNGELIRMQLQLQRFEPTLQELQGWTTAPRSSFGPFDESRFTFRTIVITVVPRLSSCAEPQAHTLMDIVVALERTTGAAEYWKLSEEFSGKDDDRCDPNEEAWSVANVSGDPPMLAPATPDPAIPIVSVGFRADWPGRTSANKSNQLIIDARTAQPILTARLSLFELDGFCTFAVERPNADCAWDGDRQDFLCTESFRGARRYVWMTSGERIARAPGSTAPRDLSGFIDALISSPERIGKWAEPDDVGAVRLIAEWAGRTNGRRIFLFGAAHDISEPFIVAVREGGRTRVIPVRGERVFGPSPASSVTGDDPPVRTEEFRPVVSRRSSPCSG